MTAGRPDEAADRAAGAAGVRIRTLDELADFAAVCRLYDGIWRPDPANPPITVELLRALTKAGNYVAGAYDGTALVGAGVGFFAAPAQRELHSHIAGVSAAALGCGVGFALKLHQRAWSLRRDVATITWTFDPLVRRNAHFNLTKLAAVPAEYLPDFYGGMHDGINTGDESDRLLVRWELTAPQVERACAGAPRPGGAAGGVSGRGTAGEVSGRGTAGEVSGRGAEGERPAGVVALGRDAAGAPVRGDRSGPTVLVAVPDDVESMRRTLPDAARRWRIAVREVLGGLLAGGARVTAFDRAGYYVVTRTPEGTEA